MQNVSIGYLCTSMTEQQEKWLQQIELLFLRYGIKSLTMDDIARELGISKKTLYQFVENKDDLVKKVLEAYIGREKGMCAYRFPHASNALEEMRIVVEMNTSELAHMKSNIIYDLQRYHRDSWEMMLTFRNEFLYQVVRNNLERGISEGLYRNDFNVDIVTRLHISATFQLFDENLFPSSMYSRSEVFMAYFIQYMYGILSDRGVVMFRQMFNNSILHQN